MLDFYNPGFSSIVGDPARYQRVALYDCQHLAPFTTANPSRTCPNGHHNPGGLVRTWDFELCHGCGCGLLYLGRRPSVPCRGDRKHGRPEVKFHAVACGDCGRNLLAAPDDALPSRCSGSGDHPSAVPLAAVAY